MFPVSMVLKHENIMTILTLSIMTIPLCLITLSEASNISFGSEILSRDKRKSVCKINTFGSECQFRCNCLSKEHCDNNGGKCQGPCRKNKLGPHCQYSPIGLVGESDDNNIPRWVTDDDINTCNPGTEYTERMAFRLQYKRKLAWVKIAFKTKANLTFWRSLELYVVREDGTLHTCPNAKRTYGKDTNGKTSQHIIELPCFTPYVVSSVLLKGTSVKEVCSLELSSGHSVTHHFTTEPNEKMFTTITKESTCIYKWPQTGVYVRIISFDDDHNDAPTKLTAIDVDGITHILSKTTKTRASMVFGYIPNKPIKQISHPKIVGKECSLVAHGDYACEAGHWGIGCRPTKKCNCRDSKEQCHQITGACRSGCKPGTKCEKALCSQFCKKGETGCLRDGSCIGGCKEGFGSPECNRVCKVNDCDKYCSWNCAGKCKSMFICDKCKPGYKILTCKEPCAKGMYGQNCRERCPGCKRNKCDNVHGHCLHGCKAGLIGIKCTSQCPKNFFGRACAQRCSYRCANRLCNHKNGHCLSCPPGALGPLCNKACPAGKYGEGCSENCPQSCKDSCSARTGKCTSCPGGKFGPNCEHKCPQGRYGPDCTKLCSDNCIGGVETCDPVTGTCTLGCKGNFDPPTCTDCQRMQGASCASNCTNCNENGCDSLFGTCLTGCTRGFTGLTCEEECSEYTFSYDCNETCSDNCYDKRCNSVTGQCLKCPSDKFGPFCTESHKKRNNPKNNNILRPSSIEAIGRLVIGMGLGFMISTWLCLMTPKQEDFLEQWDEDLARGYMYDEGGIYETYDPNSYYQETYSEQYNYGNDNYNDIEDLNESDLDRVMGGLNGYHHHTGGTN